MKKFENTEKYSAFCRWRQCICWAGTALEKTQPLEYVCCGRELLPVAGENTPVVLSNGGKIHPGSRGNYRGGADHGTSGEPGPSCLGLSDRSGELPGADLPALLTDMDSRIDTGDGII